jgi:hypothetical protein
LLVTGAVVGGLAAFAPPAMAQDLAPPTSAATVPNCTGVVPVAVADPGGALASGPAGAMYRIDLGQPRFAPVGVAGNPNVAVINVPEGVHGLEYWGIDNAGNQEPQHHVARVNVDHTLPSILFSGDNIVRRGERATLSILASDPSGLLLDPTNPAFQLNTARAGDFNVTLRATDRCNNTRQTVFEYRVAAPPRVRISRRFAVSAVSDVPLRSVGARLDGRKLRVRRRPGSLGIRLPRRLSRGVHRLTVSVTDEAGNRTRVSRRARF